MPTHEIYAIQYAGPLTSSGAFLMWMRNWETIEQRAYYVWCLKGPEGPAIVDAGVAPGLATAREINGYRNPADLLKGIDVDAEAVQHLILTHIHWDHANGIDLFPNATCYVQEREYRFWMEDPISKKPPFQHVLDDETRERVRSLERAGRLVLTDGDEAVLPGVACVLAPGHTVGLQAVAVDTSRGEAILGSDCAHLFRNYAEDWPSALITDLVAWMKTYDKLRSRVASPELLFPGHDILMAEDFPQVADRITRLV
jgi:glyoxylase-like metal-dependent hydrolase (beta-lactamase superfamily II)